MYGFYLIPKSFDCKIGNIFKFSGYVQKPEDRKNTERKLNYEDITLAVIIVKTIIVIYYIIMKDNCQWQKHSIIYYNSSLTQYLTCNLNDKINVLQYSILCK